MYTYERPILESGDGFTGYMVDEASTIKSFDHSTIHRSKQFEEAMKYFDNTDDLTRNVLLSVNEADQNVVMTSLSNKLYKHIVDKVDDIDFGTIPQSKGDITKIDNYEELRDCINIITEVLANYNQSTDAIDTVSLALQNMIDRREMFMKAYKLNVEMPIVIYNTIALAIVSSVSLMITSCIEFVKLPDDQGFDIALDKAGVMKSRDNLLYKDLYKFNRMCGSGDFDKAMDFIIKNNANQFAGAGFAFGASSVAVGIGLILLIIPVIRELIFFFYYSRAKASDYFDAQASLLMINAYNIENNLSREEKSRKEIAAKQRKISDNFKKISNTLKIKSKTAEQSASKEITEIERTKFKQQDVLDRIPDSSNATLF